MEREREANLARLNSFEIPSKRDVEYINCLYRFKDLRILFDSYIQEDDRIYSKDIQKNK